MTVDAIKKRAAIVGPLAMFAKMHSQKFSRWPWETVEEYFEHFLRQNRMVWVQREDGLLCAIGTGYQCEIEDCHTFRWQWDNPDGDCFYIQDVIVHGVADGLPILMQEFAKRIPNWERLKVVGHRDSGSGKRRLMEYSPRVLKRLKRKVEYGF